MLEWADSVRQNLRYAARVLVRAPSFTLTAVASLALGIALNTTMFSVVNSLLLRPLGVNDNLVRIGRSGPNERAFRSVSYEDFTYLREHAASFAGITGHQLESLTLGTAEASQRLSAELVGASYFATLGVSLRLGRDFSADEYRVPGHAAVAVISDRFWRRQLGADPAILGRRLPINGYPFTIIGVAAPRFNGTFPGVAIDLWLPAGMAWAAKPPTAGPVETSLFLIGRLHAGLSSQTAEADLAVLARRLSGSNPAEGERRFVIGPARGAHPFFANVLRVFLTLLMAVVGVVLLIACANVAGLMLAKARARRGEVALRLAIGASRAQIVGQLLAESLLLGLLGGVSGLLLSVWPLELLDSLSFIPGPTGTPVFLDLRLDLRVLIFTAAVSLLTALVFGLLPALQTTRVALTSALQDPRSTAGRARLRLGSSLVVLQVCVSFVLLVGSMLLFRSLHNIQGIDLGFDPDHVFVASVDLAPLGYDRSQTEQFHASLLAGARQLPGVTQAALSSFVALNQSGGHPVPLEVTGAEPPAGERELTVRVARVSDDYFATMRQALIKGRDFGAADRAATHRVAIVNEAMTRRYWPGKDALGARIGLGEDVVEHEIIGIVANARFASFGGTIEPLVFLPEFAAGKLHVRSAGQPAEVMRTIRRLVRDLDARAVPYLSGQSMRESMASSASLIPVKIVRAVLSVAGIVALLLAAGGLYGLISYTLEQRMKEIGIRVALGADRLRVFRAIVGGAFRLSGIGLVLGIGLAAGVMRVISRFLYGLSPIDPLSFGAIAGLLVFVTLAAGYTAARRGLGVDPMAILRYE